ncbi:aminoglycoside adenylyltransferase domain-containing protein [Neobacillus sp. YIM B06451]|uniref:aminoglycoside adenylyltransferase domain-containing protein n=1 Tax=Neobacillus sp. YIM B06451 TaxID=3070994 RepID=UPI0029302B53|nr:aminoglycoside adenylyltransferase domain-containing protein [Neobacillus sp. YIM B06451]
MAYSWDTCSPEIKEFVFILTNKTKEIIEDNFVGFYLHGSLSMGGFNPHCSDIDILVVTDRSIDMEAKRRLAELFLTHSNNPFQVEVSFLNREQLRDFEHPCPFDFHFSEYWRTRYEEDLSLGTYIHLNAEVKKDPDLAAHITIINQRGICIEGSPIMDVFPSIPESFYTSSILGDFNDCLENIFENPVYCTLNMIRVYWYLSEGMISSKQEAGTWGLTTLPKEMNQTLQKVIHNYSHESEAYMFERNEFVVIRSYFSDKVQRLWSKKHLIDEGWRDETNHAE